jgi:hypothetical protein
MPHRITQLALAEMDRLAVAGTAEEFRLLVLAHEHAVRCGLNLPSYTPTFFAPPAVEEELTLDVRGKCFHTVRPVRVFLRAGMDLPQLLRTTLHELQHVADAAHPDLWSEEREARAERFVRSAMARWGRSGAW